MLNSVNLIGNVGKAPEVKRLESGVSVAKLSIATTENYKDKDGEWQKQTEWHDIVAWRNEAEKVEKYVKSGSQLHVKGKLVHRKYTNKDGVEVRTTEVVANKIIILGAKDKSAKVEAAETPTTTDQNEEAPAQVGEDGLPF